jgi:hypothetical protein
MACRLALEVQDASNPLGVLLAWARTMDDLYRAGLGGNQFVREHPASVLFLDKLADMMGRPKLGDICKASDTCLEVVRLATEHADAEGHDAPDMAALAYDDLDSPATASDCAAYPCDACDHAQACPLSDVQPPEADPRQETPTPAPHVPQEPRTGGTGSIAPDDPRIAEFLTLWHENGRSRFERDYSNLDYDAESYCKTARDRNLYIALDNGMSGCFLLEKSTGLVYGIKAYGKIHRGHLAGHLDILIRTYREANAHNREFDARNGLPQKLER